MVGWMDICRLVKFYILKNRFKELIYLHSMNYIMLFLFIVVFTYSEFTSIDVQSMFNYLFINYNI